MNGTVKPVSAPAVSRALSTAGMVVSPAARMYKHEGVYVQKNVLGSALVTVDILPASHRTYLTDLIVTTLTANGYVCDTSEHGDAPIAQVMVRRPVR